MKVYDARDLPCPQPVILTKEALEEVQVGEEIKVIVNSEVSLMNIKKFLSAQGHKLVEVRQQGNEYELFIKKGSPGEEKTPFQPTCELGQPPSAKELFFIIATDTLGKEEELGKILMKGFWETLSISDELPQRIFFMNRGVFLTTKNEEVITLLKRLEEKGVEIYSCGTCLKYYQLEKDLKVGKSGGTDIYLTGILEFKKTIFIG